MEIFTLQEFKLYESINNDNTDLEIVLENEINNCLNIINELEKSDIDAVKDTGKRGLGWGTLRVGAWVLFFEVMLLRELYKYIVKGKRIKKLLADETDPVKKESLKSELKSLKVDQVKILSKIEDSKKKAKEKADKISDEELDKMKDKIVDKKEEVDTIKDEIKDIKEKEQ